MVDIFSLWFISAGVWKKKLLFENGFVQQFPKMRYQKSLVSVLITKTQVLCWRDHRSKEKKSNHPQLDSVHRCSL